MMPKTYFSTPLSKSAKEAEGRLRNIFQGQRKRPAVLVLALVAAVVLLCGSVVAVRAREAGTEQKNIETVNSDDAREQEIKEAASVAPLTASEEVTSLPAFEYQGDDPYLAAVCKWTVEGEGSKYLQAEVTIPCPLIAEIDGSDPQDVRIWGNFCVFLYTPRGTTLLTVSGGECPGLLHLRTTDDGYEVFDMEAVEDGEGYGESMRRIFGTRRMKKLDGIDGAAVRAQYIADYVRWNDLPFTQYQDYGWAPVHIPGTPETPESAQTIHHISPMGYSIDYDLREFCHDVSYDRLELLTGVGELAGISIRFERYVDTDVETVVTIHTEQMEQPRRVETTFGADRVPATMLRDGSTRDEVVKDTYVIALGENDCLAITVRNIYYAFPGDPIVSGADAVLEKTLETFRLTEVS